MTRRQRQLDELRGLCVVGSFGRAIDLAYEHLADFGPTDEITVLIADAMEHLVIPDTIRHRFEELLRAQR